MSFCGVMHVVRQAGADGPLERCWSVWKSQAGRGVVASGAGKARFFHLWGDGSGTKSVEDKLTTFLNLLTTPIEAGTHCIFVRDKTLKNKENKYRGVKVYLAIPRVPPQQPGTFPHAILTQATPSPLPLIHGEPDKDLIFTSFRTNDPATFAPTFDHVENPLGGAYNGVKVKNNGDYIIRWGYNPTIEGVGTMSEGDDPNGDINAAQYILRHFATATWQTVINIYKGVEQEVGDTNEPPTHNSSLFYFANREFSCSCADTDHFSVLENRTFRIHLKNLSAENYYGVNRVNVFRAYLEIYRINFATDQDPI
jgi:hypothetical protein